MTGSPEPRIARLTWQAGDPATVVASLGRRLGFDGGPVDERGAGILLGVDVLEVVPWRREAAGDDPMGDGRLVFEPVTGEPEARDGSAAGTTIIAARGLPALVGVAWATVELDRAAADLDPWLEPAEDGAADLPEPLLGALARPRGTTALPGGVVVLVEPTTEGRLAASLARDGEGPCAIYLRPAGGLTAWVAAARRRGVTVSGRRVGPLGPCVLVPGGTIAGPHVIVVDRPKPASKRRGTGTIAP